MKIKEKGLTGKAATSRKDLMVTRPRGFNAFQEMGKGDKSKSKGEKGKAKPEIWLEFMGTRLRVHEDNGGSVKSEDVPYVKGSTLKFTGCGGDVSFKDIKVSPFVDKWIYADGGPSCSNRCKSVSRECLSSSMQKATIGVSLVLRRPYRRTK
jgi:hypothetical protein